MIFAGGISVGALMRNRWFDRATIFSRRYKAGGPCTRQKANQRTYGVAVIVNLEAGTMDFKS